MNDEEKTGVATMVVRIRDAAARETTLFREGCSAVWTACLGWAAIRTARFILG
ncbi:hypothetical protein [Methylobacterium nodulans]|uniref:hypothetical protein n=1 Tax=Methylobacterium nodulans TaxID=114616 RepID=UPI0018DBF550|nr:hypothetical protein [Methylobacterium nodulans]